MVGIDSMLLLISVICIERLRYIDNNFTSDFCFKLKCQG